MKITKKFCNHAILVKSEEVLHVRNAYYIIYNS